MVTYVTGLHRSDFYTLYTFFFIIFALMVSEIDKNNKGVNATSDSFPDETRNCLCESDTDLSTTLSSSVTTNNNNYHKSLTRVKEDLQNAIDLMGPITPQFTHTHNTTSSEADNEESFATTEPLSSEIFKGELTYNSQSTALAVVPQSNTNTHRDEPLTYCCNCNCPATQAPQFCVKQTRPHMNYVSPQIQPQIEVVECRRSPRIECRNKGGIMNWIKNSYERFSFLQRKVPCELYKMNIATADDDNSPPRRLIFDLVDGIPKPDMSNVATSTKSIEKLEMQRNNVRHQYYTEPPIIKEIKNDQNNRQRYNRNYQEGRSNNNRQQQKTCFTSDGDAKVDFYYFDHGNAQYFNTTDTQHIVICEMLAEKTERYTTKFWAEIFATIHLGFSFFISFILQLFKFLLYSILRPLSVGMMQLTSDYFFKPFLTTLFNGIIQPLLIFCYNVATSIRDLCDPIAEGIGYFFRELSVLCKSIRLCNYNKRHGCDSPLRSPRNCHK